VTTVAALVIRPDRADVLDVGTAPADLQAVIGGQVRAVTGPDWILYYDEGSGSKDQDPNPFGDLLVRRLLHQADVVAGRGRRSPPTGMPESMLSGVVAFLGLAGGELTDVPQRVVDVHKTLTGLYAN
jgi:hypothetical protein